MNQNQEDIDTNSNQNTSRTPELFGDKTDDKIEGKIIFLNKKEGWGFIVSDSIKFERIYFHWSGLIQDTLRFKELEKGMDVRFLPIEGERGFRAIKIEVLENE